MIRNLILISVLLLNSCALTRNVVIEQGNPNLMELSSQLGGLTTDEVRELLGPPQSRWNIDHEVWIYYNNVVERGELIDFSVEIHFDDVDTVEEIITTTPEVEVN